VVYRRSETGLYESVPGSITEVILTQSEVSMFRCRTMTVSQSFEIQENDVVGACVWNQGEVNPLYLVGDTGDNTANERLYQYNRRNTENCDISRIASINTARTDIMLRSQSKLHLYITTGKLYSPPSPKFDIII